MSHDIATDAENPKEPVSQFRLTSWAAQNWAIVAFILMIVGAGLNAYALNFLTQAGVTRKEYDVQESKLMEFTKASNDFRSSVDAAVKISSEVNQRQDIAINGLQQSVGDIKDSIRDIRTDQKETNRLLRGK